MINNYNSLSYRTCPELSSQEPEVVGNAPNSNGFMRWSWLMGLILFLSVFVGQDIMAQGPASAYAFLQQTETYTQVVGTNSTATGDDGIQDGINIGFSFVFDQVTYTQFGISTNGWIRLGSVPIATTGSWTNVLDNAATHRPLIAPFWDDNHRNTGSIQYSVSGTAPNRILEVGWHNINIGGTGSTSTTNFASYKLRLYETTNVIEFVYGPTMATAGTLTASVGINGASSYLSVTPAASSTVSSTTANNSISATTNLVGKRFRFSPPVVTTPPNCATALVPANAATNVVRNPAFSWTAATGSPTSYDVYLGTSTPAALVASNVAGTTYTHSSALLANTLYYYKVVAKNANGSAVGCVEQSFTTGTSLSYCTPVYTSGKTSGDLISNISISGTTLSNNSGTAQTNPAYTYFTGQPNYTATLQAGSSYNVNVTVGTWGNQAIKAWIDYNDNGFFEASEIIGTTIIAPGQSNTGPFPPATFAITLSCNPPLGMHRMRVRSIWNVTAASIDPCASAGFGETEDYNITISAPDPCPAPSNLAAASITSSGASLSWTLGCAETAWEVVVQAAGGGAPTGAGTPNGSTTYTAGGLSAGTAYEFYVRAVCSAGVLYSSWSGPFAFSTVANVPVCSDLVSPANGATNVAITGGAAQLTWTAPPTSPTQGVATSYDVYFGTTSGALTLIGNLPAPTSGNPTVGITGLTYNQTNYWRIVPRNSGGVAVGPCSEWSFTTQGVPANDVCSGAVNLDALTSPITSSTVGYTNDVNPSCSTSLPNGPDAFYSITVPNGYTLVIGQTTNDYDSVHSLFYGSCASQTEILCLDDVDETNATWVNTTGSTQTVYWVQDGYQSGAGLFTLAWTLTPPPVVVTSFTPTSVCGTGGGTPIVITGSHFTGTTNVQFNGISAASIVVNSDTQITAVLPAGNTSGPITVYVTPSSNGSASSATNLVVNAFPTVSPIAGDNAICLSSPTLLLSNGTANGAWSSSNEAVATVNSISGEVTGLSVGSTIISYAVTENGCTTTVTHNVGVSEEVVITLQPAPVVVVTGTDSQFSVTATGTGLTYQWEVSVDGNPFTALSEAAPYSGTQTNTLSIDNTPGSLNNNEYRCVVSGVAPCAAVESSSAILNVGSTGIETNPSNVNLCDSGTAEFTVVASGDIVPPSEPGDDPVVYSYQWWEDQGFGPEPIVDGGNYSGANEAVLTIANVTTANNGWTYYVVVNGPGNDPQSTTATLSVATGVSVNSQPSSIAICRTTTTATFNVGATGDVSSIQWQVSPNGSTAWTNAGTGSSLNVNIIPATPVGVTYYRATVNGNASCPSVDSDVVTLTVNQPTVSVTPGSASYCTPGSAVSLTASGAVSYVWSPSTGLSATTGATVLASPSTTTTYTVVGTDASGCTNSTTVTVTASDAIQATATTNLTEVCAGATAQLGVNTTFSGTNYTIGTGIYKFSSSSQTFTPITGTAVVGVAAAADDSVSSSTAIGFPFNYGGTVYNNFRVSSNGVLMFNATGSSTATNDLATTTASLRTSLAPLWDDLLCSSGITYQVSGSSPNRVLTVQWLNMRWNYQAANPVISFQVKLYETSGDIEYIYRQETSPYTFTTNNTLGASIGLMGTASANYLSLQDVSANPLLSTSTSLNTITTRPATGQVYRFTRQTPSYSWTSTPAGFTSTIQNPTVNPAVSTTYNVVVTSPNGCTATSSVTVNIVSGAAITTQPTSISRCAGAAASFTVVATGPGLTYAWRRNGTPITGNASATTATLNLASVVEANEATYDVVITPSCGAAVTSNPATLTVNDIPTAVPTNNGPVCAGSTLNLTGTTSNGVTFSWTGPNGFTSNVQNPSIASVTAAAAGVYTFSTTSADGCSFSGTTTVTVSANPMITITSSGSQSTACAGEIKTLTADYAPGTPYTIYSENFNGATDNWTKINSSTGATAANIAWTLRSSPYAFAATGGAINISSNDNSQFYLSNPDAATSGVTTFTILQSPAFSTIGVPSASISYFHFYKHLTLAQNVEYSTNGTTWTSLKTYNTTQGAPGAFVEDTIALPAGALNQATVYIRFRYQDGWAWHWAIDNFKVTGLGTPPANPTWSPTAGLYTDAAATVPYTGGPAHSVYAAVTSPVSYTATATTVQGCTTQTTKSFTMTTTGCPSVTTIQTTQCGSTLSTINQQIYADLVSGAQAYRFRVTDLSTNQVQSIDKVLRVFQLTQLTNYAFNRTYRIEVSVRLNDVWQPYYGPSCTITTPAATTKVQTAQCGSTLTTMGDVIYADNVPYATGYKFRITNLLTSAQQEIERPLREVRLTQLTNPEFNTTYSVEVAVRNTDGTYLPYGPVCNVSSPSFPTTQLQLSQCDVVITNNNATIYADSYSGATTYRFRFVNTALGYSYQFDKPIRSFVLSSVPGLLAGQTYSVQVSVEINGVFGPFGKVCTLTTPGGTRTIEPTIKAVDFQAIASPNPFADNFKLDVKTSAEDMIQVRVYDMLGKLIEDRNVSVSSIAELEVGANYPAGVYNVIVSQGENVKTLRVIKR